MYERQIDLYHLLGQSSPVDHHSHHNLVGKRYNGTRFASRPEHCHVLASFDIVETRISIFGRSAKFVYYECSEDS